MFGIDDAIGAGAGMLGGLFSLFGGTPKKKYLDKSLDYYNQVNPNVTSKDVGGIQDTAFNQVDPATRAAMMGALSSLQDKYRQGGLDQIDRAKAAELEQAQTGRAKANRAAVVEDARKHGTLNSGRALVAQLTGVDSAGKAASDAAVQQAAEAEKARQATLGHIVGTAGTVQKGDFAKANANDALKRFNKGLEEGNVNRNMQAQEYSVRNALDRASGVGNLAKDAPNTNPAQDFLGTAGQIGAGVAKNQGWQIGGGDAKAPSASDYNDESDQGWKWGGGFGGSDQT